MKTDQLPLFFKHVQAIQDAKRKKTMAEKEIPPEIKKLLELYQNSVLVKYGAPDEFQYHQNKLTKGLAEFILNDYLNK